MPRDIPEYNDDGPQWSESENDRGSESLSSESDFEDKKAQSKFDNWMVSLPDLYWKTMAVLLMELVRK